MAALVLYLVSLVATCAYAFMQGGRCERLAAVAILSAAVASQAAAALGPGWKGPDFGLLFVDTMFFAALLWVAHKSRRFWPIWAAASQLVGTLTHFAVMAQDSVVANAYATIQPFWAFPTLAAIAIGTRGEQQDQAAAAARA